MQWQCGTKKLKTSSSQTTASTNYATWVVNGLVFKDSASKRLKNLGI